MAAALALDDPNARIVDQNNLDAFRNLNRVSAGGALTVGSGRDLTVAAQLDVSGGVTVGPGIVGDDTTVTVTANLNQTAGAITIRPGTLGVGGDLSQSAGAITLAGGRLNVAGQMQIGGSLVGNGTVNGTVTNGGLIGPGASAGLMEIVGILTTAAQGRVEIEIGGLSPGVGGYDRIAIDGVLDFEGERAGSIAFSLLPGFVPRVGDTFDVITFTGRDERADFADYSGMQLGGGLWLEPSYTPASLRVVVVPAPGAGAVGPGALPIARRRVGGEPRRHSARQISHAEPLAFQTSRRRRSGLRRRMDDRSVARDSAKWAGSRVCDVPGARGCGPRGSRQRRTSKTNAGQRNLA